MKNILFTIVLSVLAIIGIAGVHTNDIIVNQTSSSIKWTGSKASGSKHSGTINISKGKLVFDHGRLVGGEMIIDMNSIKNTDIKSERKSQRLVDHLKNEDFFFVEKYPTAILKIISAERMPDNLYKVAADLTIKGITNRITFTTHLTIKKDGFLGTANIKIDRTKWDIKYGSGSFFEGLGDRMILDEIEFDIFLLSVK
ncbi:YceI family protein [Flavobacteriales bacterium]|nr:YceI family protein [Flavobacteriales bacterium]